jgi:FkbM family methyltransferase
MIPLIGAKTEDVPLVDPAVFVPSIRLIAADNVHPGQIHEADFLFFKDVAPDSVFCDIGANLGLSILSFAAAGGRCETHSFEVNPSLYPILREMAATTPNPWTLHEFGLSDESGTHSLFIARSDELYVLGESSLRLDYLQDPRCAARIASYSASGSVFVGRIEVELRRFDDVGIVPTHIKIDVEGAEIAVLRGMRETLRLHKPLLMIETGAILGVNAELLPQGYKPYFFDAAAMKLRPWTRNVLNTFYLHAEKVYFLVL